LQESLPMGPLLAGGVISRVDDGLTVMIVVLLVEFGSWQFILDVARGLWACFLFLVKFKSDSRVHSFC
jgi:hypothetical protein